MKKLSLILSFILLLSVSAMAKQNTTPTSDTLIRHTVAFKLKHPKGSMQENEFFDASVKLSTIPSLQNFKIFRETSPKNEYDYFFYMEFKSAKDYEAYNAHPDHVKFVENFWVKDVDIFIEIDYEAFK